MFKEISVSWDDFKSAVTERTLTPQWLDNGEAYDIYAPDGFILFNCFLAKADASEFEADYKDIWNQPQIPRSTESGLERFYSSPRPQNTSTYFCGQGDDTASTPPVIGGGQELFIDMTTSDTSKTIYLDFTESIFPKDGIVFFKDAPIGAKVDVFINHPLAGNVGYFVKNLRICGDNVIGTQLNSEDIGEMPAGLQLAIKVYNGDTPADFQVWGLFEVYRATIV